MESERICAYTMAHSLMVLAIRLVEILFFTGLVGCISVVTISWISIFRDGFSDPETHKPTLIDRPFIGSMKDSLRLACQVSDGSTTLIVPEASSLFQLEKAPFLIGLLEGAFGANPTAPRRNLAGFTTRRLCSES